MKIVRPGETFSATSFEDDARNEPAILAWNSKVTIGRALRNPSKDYVRDDDPPLAKWFDGSFLPKLGCDFSHHDFARAFIVAMGSCDIRLTSVTSDVAVLVLPNPDGAYGTTNVSISYSKARFGVMASGQKNLNVRIANSTQLLYADEIPGHALYMNECRKDGKYLRGQGVTATVGKARSIAVTPNAVGDHCTAKFKGCDGVDYTCLDDMNPCGALDSFQSSGVARIVWKHPGGSTKNPVFGGFRLGDGQPLFGDPKAFFAVAGDFDGGLCPDKNVPVAAVHVLGGKVCSLGVRVMGRYDVYGVAQPLFPLDAIEIPK